MSAPLRCVPALAVMLAVLGSCGGEAGEHAAAPPPAPAHKMVVDEAAAQAHFDRGNQHVLKGEAAPAIAEYTEAIRLNPRHYEAYYNRGYVYRAGLGDLESARDDYTSALEIKPDLEPALNNRATILTDLGDFDGAVEDFTKAIVLNPREGSLYFNRAQSYEGLGEYRLALEDYNKATELMPDDAGPWDNRGVVHEQLGEHELALADYGRALELDPQPQTYVNRALTCLSIKRYEQAIADCTKALELEPEFADAYQTRAIALEALGRNGQAQADYRRAQAGDGARAR